MSQIRHRYRPNVGVLQPDQVVTIGIDPAIGSHELPILLSAENRALIMNMDPDWVRIRNSSRVITPYLLLVVPQAMVDIARHPWPEVAENFAADLKTEHGLRALIRGLAAIVARSS